MKPKYVVNFWSCFLDSEFFINSTSKANIFVNSGGRMLQFVLRWSVPLPLPLWVEISKKKKMAPLGLTCRIVSQAIFLTSQLEFSILLIAKRRWLVSSRIRNVMIIFSEFHCWIVVKVVRSPRSFIYFLIIDRAKSWKKFSVYLVFRLSKYADVSKNGKRY